MLNDLKKYQLQISVLLLLVFYGIGLGGMLLSDDAKLFASLSWLNLLVSGLVLFFNHKKWTVNLVFSLLIIAIAGFFVEVAGVKTGVIFGRYFYGDSLGWKWMDVPLIIGLNWVMLCYFSVYTWSKWFKSVGMVVLLASVTMVGLDMLIEPLAEKLGFWSWHGHQIPVRNYLAWWVLSVLFCGLLVMVKKSSENKIAPYLLVVQMAFFASLLILL